MPEKGVLGQFVDLRGGLGKKEGGGFEEGVDTPMHTNGKIHSIWVNRFFQQTNYFQSRRKTF